MRLLLIAISALFAGETLFVSAQQKPLTGVDEPPARSFEVREQSPDLCDAGSRQWTGSINITDDKSMFFWYFESRRNPDTDPLVLWLSGGPGASGEMGVFMGSGPCSANRDGNSTTRLDYSWTDHANVVYVDQPVGVGFSQITDRNQIAVTLEQGAQDVHSFLSALSHEVFPELAGRPWHITGESMGGHYVTAYTQHIASHEQENVSKGLEPRINITSAVILDGYIDATRQFVGYYDFFCTNWASDGRKVPLMNETACSAMGAAIPTCELMGARCRETYDIKVCRAANEFCEETIGEYFLDGIRPGGWDPYDSRHPCEIPPLCSNLANGPPWKFLNKHWVQKKLGFHSFPFDLIDYDTSARWENDGHIHLPVTRELTWILDQTGIKVLFINGNNDIIINTPGQMRMLDEQPWEGQEQYQSLAYDEWHYSNGDITTDSEGWGVKKGGFWKGTGRLRFYSVDEAGHLSAYHQPEAIGAILRAWLNEFES